MYGRRKYHLFLTIHIRLTRKSEPLCISAWMFPSSSGPIVLALTQIGCGNISPCFNVLEPVARRPQRRTAPRPYKSPLFHSWEPRKPLYLIAALEAVAHRRWGCREITKQKPFYSVSGCSPLSQFASICSGNRAGDTCGQTPRPGKGRSVQLSSNKVKGAMHYAALRVARLIRAGVGCGACVGDLEAGLHLGSVPCGCPELFFAEHELGSSGGIRNTEEAPGGICKSHRGPSPSISEVLFFIFLLVFSKAGSQANHRDSSCCLWGIPPPCFISPKAAEGCVLVHLKRSGRQALKAKA